MDKMRRDQLASNIIFYSVFLLFLAGTAYMFGSMNDVLSRPRGVWAAIYFSKSGIEIVASGFAIFYILVAVTYRKPDAIHRMAKPTNKHSHIAIAYLCCEDMDQMALQSVVECGVKHSAHLLLHDDSNSKESREMVNAAVKGLEDHYSVSIQVLRRPHRVGGKPGAVNNILPNLPPSVEFLLLCDNDSFLSHDDFLDKALTYFDVPEVAIVQFRNLGHVNEDDSHGYRTLSASIDFYDAFVSFMDRFGWSPFLGHNALMRVSAMRKVGGFTPGQLADDIDYSVKIRLHGYAIRYAREITAGEKHPLTYESLRKRTQKWTYGCTQILMRWGWAVLKSRQLSPAEKMTFFLTVGYYHFQLLLLVYLFIFYICLPFDAGERGSVVNLMISAGLILFFTFMPSITYFMRNGNLSVWPKSVVYWGLTYGSQDFVMFKAALKCLLHSHLAWTPTNSISKRELSIHYLPEVLFAICILTIAVTQHPALLILPTTILFAGKFLVAPSLNTLVFGKSVRDIDFSTCSTTSPSLSTATPRDKVK
jgi:cellulose synthase/poly-beta-1,6-N-acetylglucosamine synthase-like glycosyltransferase